MLYSRVAPRWCSHGDGAGVHVTGGLYQVTVGATGGVGTVSTSATAGDTQVLSAVLRAVTV